MNLMKTVILGIAVFAVSGAGFADTGPQVLNQLPKAVYIPVGFDNNDNNIQVIIEGQLSNTCYRVGNTYAEVDQVNKIINIKNTTVFYNSDFCLMVLMDYKKEVNLGMIQNVGDYTVQFADSEGSFTPLANLNIAEATTIAQDDHIYADVRTIRFAKEAGAKAGFLYLHGLQTNSCLEIDRVELSRPTAGVVQVLPIAKQNAGVECKMLPAPVPFAHKVSLEGIGHGRVLIHVRSQNGQAINMVENI